MIRLRSLLACAALLLVWPGSASGEGRRYSVQSTGAEGVFVLDHDTGRVWRYDRVDDAWYLYDLERIGSSEVAPADAPKIGPDRSDPQRQSDVPGTRRREDGG